MRRLLTTKTVAVGIILVVTVLLAGVAVASTSQGVTARNTAQQSTAGESPSISLDSMTVQQGKPAITIYGSGFAPYEIALVEIVVGGSSKPIIVGGKLVSEAETFSIAVVAGKLGTDLTPGLYTVRATGTGGSIATAPLIVVKAK